MDNTKQSGYRQKKSEGLKDEWKSIDYGSDGSVTETSMGGTVTKYKSREDAASGKWKEITFPQRKK